MPPTPRSSSTPPPSSTPPDSNQPTELKAVAAEEGQKATSWHYIARRGRNYGRVIALLIAILVIGAGGGYVISIGLGHPAAKSPTPAAVQSLSSSDIQKLSQIGNNLGTSNQILTIAASSVFQGKVNVNSDLTVGGHLNVNGPVSFPGLVITGQTTVANLAAQNLQISGLTNAQDGLSVQGLAAVNGNLSVSGAVTTSSLTTNTISTKAITISGPFTISHITTTGPPVTASTGSAVGGGGTASVSGNDTTGTIAINTGNSPGSGTLISVTFKSSYSAAVHVLLTPLTGAAAAAPVYVNETATGFSLRIDSAAPSGSNLSYSYFVTQ